MPKTNPTQSHRNQLAVHRDFTPDDLGVNLLVIPQPGTFSTPKLDISGMRFGVIHFIVAGGFGGITVDVEPFDEQGVAPLPASAGAGFGGAGAVYQQFVFLDDNATFFRVLRFLRFNFINADAVAITVTARAFFRS